MAAIITNKFRINNAEQFVESFSESAALFPDCCRYHMYTHHGHYSHYKNFIQMVYYPIDLDCFSLLSVILDQSDRKPRYCTTRYPITFINGFHQ